MPNNSPTQGLHASPSDSDNSSDNVSYPQDNSSTPSINCYPSRTSQIEYDVYMAMRNNDGDISPGVLPEMPLSSFAAARLITAAVPYCATLGDMFITSCASLSSALSYYVVVSETILELIDQLFHDFLKFEPSKKTKYEILYATLLTGLALTTPLMAQRLIKNYPRVKNTRKALTDMLAKLCAKAIPNSEEYHYWERVTPAVHQLPKKTVLDRIAIFIAISGEALLGFGSSFIVSYNLLSKIPLDDITLYSLASTAGLIIGGASAFTNAAIAWDQGVGFSKVALLNDLIANREDLSASRKILRKQKKFLKRHGLAATSIFFGEIGDLVTFLTLGKFFLAETSEIFNITSYAFSAIFALCIGKMKYPGYIQQFASKDCEGEFKRLPEHYRNGLRIEKIHKITNNSEEYKLKSEAEKHPIVNLINKITYLFTPIATALKLYITVCFAALTLAEAVLDPLPSWIIVGLLSCLPVLIVFFTIPSLLHQLPYVPESAMLPPLRSAGICGFFNTGSCSVARGVVDEATAINPHTINGSGVVYESTQNGTTVITINDGLLIDDAPDQSLTLEARDGTPTPPLLKLSA